ARSTLECVRGAQHAGHGLSCFRRLFELERALAQLREQLARFDAKIFVRISRHFQAAGLTNLSKLFESDASSAAVPSVCPELTSVSLLACATLAIATFTCSTAVDCCLVDSSISRAASVVVATSEAMRPKAEATSAN